MVSGKIRTYKVRYYEFANLPTGKLQSFSAKFIRILPVGLLLAKFAKTHFTNWIYRGLTAYLHFTHCIFRW